MPARAPSLTFSPDVERFLAAEGDIDAITVVSSLLLDPDLDGQYKFQAGHAHPFVNMRELYDANWHITYEVDIESNVEVHAMMRRASSDELANKGEGEE